MGDNGDISGLDLSEIPTPLLASYGKTPRDKIAAIYEYRKRREVALSCGRWCGLHPSDALRNGDSKYRIDAMKAMPPPNETDKHKWRLAELDETPELWSGYYGKAWVKIKK